MYTTGLWSFPITIIAGIGIAVLCFVFHKRNEQANLSSSSYSDPYEQKKNYNDVCGVCTERFGESCSIRLPCHHRLHYHCLVELARNQIRICPFCRRDISSFCSRVLDL